MPGDLSVIGFDDIHIAQVTIPPLTTIQMSCFELARAAVTALRAHVEEGGEPKRNYNIDTHLVVRQSTGFPRGTTRHARKPEASKKRIPAPLCSLRSGSDLTAYCVTLAEHWRAAAASRLRHRFFPDLYVAIGRGG